MACLLERYVYFLRRRGAHGDVMSESRGGKEDMRLKTSFVRPCESGTEYLPAEQIQGVLTSRQLKVKTKQNNISGLQIADLIAHSSRCEVLHENGLFDRPLAPFAQRIIHLLKGKYDRAGNRIFGKKLLG